MLTDTRAFTTEDMNYIRHGDRALSLRFFRPAGVGPFPAVIDLHGGGWCNGSLKQSQDRAEVMAKAGLAVAALDFRHADDGYPTSLVDINYAVRWVKANAGTLDVDPGRVGLCGQSSGGHLAMLAAMRPDDPRYAAAPLPEGAPPVDAAVRCVGMSWPVINPLSRYRHALHTRAEEGARWVSDLPERHERYWKTEADMEEGNPMLILERGEPVRTPPALWVQGAPDPVHDYRDPESPVDMNEPERFAHDYREVGGEIEILYIDYPTREGGPSHDPLAAFFRRHLG